MTRTNTEFWFERSDGTEFEVLLEDIDVRFEGDGWHEPYSVYVEDYDIYWKDGETQLVEVKWMNRGIISRTCPVAPCDLERFLAKCTEAAHEKASITEEDYDEPDYDYSY